MENQPVRKLSRSTIFDLPITVASAIAYAVPALFAWIPLIGYFAWLIPIVFFVIEYRSNFVRFCAAQSLTISIIRLVFNVVFDSIRNVALRTVAIYGLSSDFTGFWGTVTNPGATANIIGIILSSMLTIVALVLAYLAYKKNMLKLYILGDVANFITTNIKPKKLFK